MTSPTPTPGWFPAFLLRPVAGTAALAVVALGGTARAHVSLPLTRSRIGQHMGDAGALVLGAAGLVAVVLILFIGGRLVRRRRRREPEFGQVVEWHQSRWAQLISVVLVIAVLVVPAVLLLLARHHPAPTGPPPGGGPAPTSQPMPTSEVPGNNSTATTAVIIALAVVAVCLAVGLFSWHRRSRRSDDEAMFEPDSAEEELLQAAVREGSAAMRDIDDPRAAIIACYTAMRRRLEESGVVSKSSDTPTQLLNRAADADVAPQAARSLTTLFLEARFSTHQMNVAQRQAAVAALRDLTLVESVTR